MLSQLGDLKLHIILRNSPWAETIFNLNSANFTHGYGMFSFIYLFIFYH